MQGDRAATDLRSQASRRHLALREESVKQRILSTRSLLVVLGLTIAALGAGCRQDMHDQPRYNALSNSSFFPDGQSSRPLVPGTVARGTLNDDSLFYTGKLEDQTAQVTGGQAQATDAGSSTVSDRPGQGFADLFPFPITAEVLNRGEAQFNIFCSVCHDRIGEGDGMIVRRGYRRPPSFHTARLRQAPAGYFFDVITNGFGAMPDYAGQISPADRWAIVAYVRALQLSQNASLADVPAEERGKLDQGGAR
jgi:mono/diheme cytochrome c family protein